MIDRAYNVKQYYRDADHARGYEDVRFAGAGGQLIDAWEKEIVGTLLRDHPRDQPLLEVAAGTGRFSLNLARQGFVVVAVDSSREMLGQLEKTARADALPITCVYADALQLPFPDRAFQTVLSLRFVWHFEDMGVVVRELARVSRGDVVFDSINRASLASLTAPIANHLVYRTLHTELATRRRSHDIVAASGLVPVEETTAFAFPFVCYRRMPAVAPALHALDRLLVRRLAVGTVRYIRARNADAARREKDQLNTVANFSESDGR